MARKTTTCITLSWIPVQTYSPLSPGSCLL